MSNTTTNAKRLAPIDKAGLAHLIEKGKHEAHPIRTIRCRTVAEARFRHLNFIRQLPAHVIDEPPQLLGDDTAPNPSEAVLAALGSCVAVGIHANAVARGIEIRSLELELEGDIDITSVWGTGETAEKPVGLTAVRARVHLDADADRATLDELVAYSVAWSPVAGTVRNPVPLDFKLS